MAASAIVICCMGSALALLVLTGCGAGGSAAKPAPAAATAHKVTYYDPDTRQHRKEEGDVLLGSDGLPTTTRHGVWTTWHPPADGGGKQFEKTYVDGVWDRQRYWREWNPDTSLRFDWRDR
jgi:hypothetical protein